MKRTISILLIIVAILLGYFGFDKLSDSGGSIEIGELEISAEDNSAKTQGYLMIGAGIISLVAGVGLLSKSRNK